MCVVKTPKIKPTDPEAQQKDPVIIRNPYLDDVTDFSRSRMGRSSLRIDPGSSRQTAPLPSSSQTRIPRPPGNGRRDGRTPLTPDVRAALDRVFRGQ